MVIKKRWVVLALSVIVILFLVIELIVLTPKRKYEDLGVPILEIYLNGVTLGEIDDGNKTEIYGGNDVVIYNNDSVNVYNNVEIKGRGNGTWAREKKPYQIRFNQKVDLFGLGKARKWNLLANHADDSHLRNDLAFKLAEMLGMKYRMEGRYIELYVDDDYRGLYYLTHAVEIGKNTVDLRDPMGVLVELDNYYGQLEDHYTTNNGDILLIEDAVTNDLSEVAMSDFVDTFNELEEAIKAKRYNKIEELIDVRSFAQYYLLSEISVNPDAYWTSLYFYKDGPEDVIHAGPGWDFDLAFSNRSWENWLGERFYSPRETMIRKEELKPKTFFDEKGISGGYETSLLISQLFFDLMDIEEFQDEVKEVFRESLSGREVEVMSFLAEQELKIKTSIEKDDKRWEKSNADEEIRQMTDWFKKRMEYMEEQYGDGIIRNIIK